MADQQIALFCAFWVVVLAVYALRDRRDALANVRVWRGVAIAAVVSAIPSYLLYYRPLTHNHGYTVPGDIEASIYSMQLRYLLDPIFAWRIYGLLSLVGQPSGNTDHGYCQYNSRKQQPAPVGQTESRLTGINHPAILSDGWGCGMRRLEQLSSRCSRCQGKAKQPGTRSGLFCFGVQGRLIRVRRRVPR